MNPLVGLFSPAIRKALYTLFGVAGLVVGAIQAYCASSAARQPSWIDGATAVLAYVGVGLGFTAASNVPTPDTEETGGDAGVIGWAFVLLVALVALVVLAIVGLASLL